MTALWVIAGIDFCMLVWMIHRDRILITTHERKVFFDNEKSVLLHNYKTARDEADYWKGLAESRSLLPEATGEEVK